MGGSGLLPGKQSPNPISLAPIPAVISPHRRAPEPWGCNATPRFPEGNFRISRRLAAHAQQAAVPVIGFLNSTSLEGMATRLVGFRQGLRENGLVEGENIAFEYR